MTDETGPGRGSRFRLPFHVIWLAPLFALMALGAWAFASPVGASPDDDYHLASIWCANGARTDLCAPDPVHGSGWRLVLPGITTAPCYVADVNESAACQQWFAHPQPNEAADHGNWIPSYPPLYYAAMNTFASTDIQTSALVMRLVNVLLFVGLTTLLAWLLPINLRVPLIAGWTIAAVPLAGYLIASNNPGSWTLIGVGGSWLAALGWYRSSGRRSWALGALTVVLVIGAAGSRTDGAVYSIIGLGIASVLAFERRRAFLLKLLIPVVLAIVAAVFYFTSGYASVASGGLNGGIPDSAARNPGAVLAFNLITIPKLWTGVFGSWGLGWRMEDWPGFSMVEFAAFVVFIGLVSLGIRAMFLRKSLMAGALVATLYVLPIYVLTVGMSVVSENVEPRYILPLVVVLGGLLLLTKEGALQPGPWHIIPAIVLLTVANALAMYTNLRRYVTGFDVQQLSLENGAEWWWTGSPVGPTALLLIGSVAFAAAVTVLGVSWLRQGRQVGAAA